MNTCDKCKKECKTDKEFKNHKCEDRVDKIKKVPKRKSGKKKISPNVRFRVWEQYIGKEIETKCFCCLENKITPFTSCNTFHAGHIKSEANGGEIEIGNLLPICSDCNKHMGTENWDEYIKRYTNFRVRIYGEKIPNSTLEKVKIIQKYIKLYLHKKVKKKKKKRKRKKTPNYLKPTVSFLRKYSVLHTGYK